MSHQHRRFIRHHVRELIATRRCMRVTLPSGRVIRGHLATRVETPPGTLCRWFYEGAKPGALPYSVGVLVVPATVDQAAWCIVMVEPITTAHAL